MLRQGKYTIQNEGCLSRSNLCVSLGLTCPGCCLHVPQVRVEDGNQGLVHQMPRAGGEQLHQVIDKLEVGEGEGEGVRGEDKARGVLHSIAAAVRHSCCRQLS